MAAVVLDVNETLLDLAGLDVPFTALAGDRAGDGAGDRVDGLKRLWFARLVHTSAVLTAIDRYEDFGTVARAVLADLAVRVGIDADDAAVDAVVGAMRQLEPHADVVPALARLRDAGVPAVALTNSGQATAEAQLAHAGIDGWFDRILSVEAVRCFKPDRRVYAHAQAVLDVPAADLVLIATHDWDCAGAMAAGWRAGFVARPGQTWNPVLPAPTWRAGDLVSLVEAILTSGGAALGHDVPAR